MPKSGDPKKGREGPVHDELAGDLTDPSFDMGRLPAPIENSEPEPGPEPEFAPEQAPPPRAQRTQTQTRLPSGGTKSDATAGPQRKRRTTESFPEGDNAPQAQDDDWGSYNDESEGWNVTSANVQLAKFTTQDLPATQAKIIQEPPRPLEAMSTSNPDAASLAHPATTGLKARFIADEPTQPPARLEGIRGADAGRTFTLDRDEVTFGREPNQSFVLQDSSVSREHARIVRDETGYVVVDNHSGNGTFVNGQRVERSRLQTGDEVSFGSAHFRFLAGGEVYHAPVDNVELAGAAPTSGWGANFMLKAAAGLCGFVVLSLIVWKASTFEWRGHSRSELFVQYQAGVAAFNDHQWDAAEAAFRAVLRLDANHVRGKRYLHSVAKQRAAEAALATAQSLCHSDDLAGCVREATPLLETVFRRDAAELLRGVDSAIEQQILRAQNALDQGDVPVATTVLQNVEAVRPGRPDVAALLTRASQTAAKPPPRPVRQVVAVRVRWPAAGPVAEAVRLFIDGDVTGARTAVETAQSDDAARLRGLLNDFKETYESALVQHRGKRAFNAIRLFNQAKAIENKISAGQSKLVSNIDTKLADMYYVLGMEAYLGSKLPEAAEDFRTAVGFAPDHALSAHKLHELEQKAQELFDEAQRIRATDTAKARSNLETVVEMLTPRDDLYRKAQSRLAGLK